MYRHNTWRPLWSVTRLHIRQGPVRHIQLTSTGLIGAASFFSWLSRYFSKLSTFRTVPRLPYLGFKPFQPTPPQPQELPRAAKCTNEHTQAGAAGASQARVDAAAPDHSEGIPLEGDPTRKGSHSEGIALGRDPTRKGSHSVPLPQLRLVGIALSSRDEPHLFSDAADKVLVMRDKDDAALEALNTIGERRHLPDTMMVQSQRNHSVIRCRSAGQAGGQLGGKRSGGT